jgi:hypothetical protein
MIWPAFGALRNGNGFIYEVQGERDNAYSIIDGGHFKEAERVWKGEERKNLCMSVRENTPDYHKA